MKLDKDFIINILDAFDSHEDAFMPVVLIAKRLNDDENLVEEGSQNDVQYIISSKLVFHLLHLQDLECIENLRGECSWGYEPIGNASNLLSPLISKSLEEDKFETPHCFSAWEAESVIRLTAIGIQMRSTLHSELSANIKKIVIEFGKLALPSALGLLIK